MCGMVDIHSATAENLLLQWRAPIGVFRVDDTSPENTIVGLHAS